MIQSPARRIGSATAATGNTGTTTDGDAGLQTEPAGVAGTVFGLAGTTCTVSESAAAQSTADRPSLATSARGSA